MPKRRTTEDHLALLRQLRQDPFAESTLPQLTNLLQERNLHGIVLQAAAALAERLSGKALIPDLAAHIEALMKDPKRDPGCMGKTPALSALVAWEADLPELYIRIASYIQPEPVMAGSKDSAGELRGLAAMGICLSRPPNALELLVDLLVDPEKQTRALAATALGRWRGAEAAPVLRLKARISDDEAEVMAEVFASLLQIGGRDQIPFIAHFLSDKVPGIVEAAALALGQSKLFEALDPLAAAYAKHRGGPLATTLLMAVGLLRSNAAADWLLARLAESRGKETLTLLDALLIYRSDSAMLKKIRHLTSRRQDLHAAYKEVFGD